MQPASFIFDLVCLAILIGSAAWCAHKGFLVSLISFFGTLVAILLAFFAARTLSPWLFDVMFRPSLEESMTQALSGQGVGDIHALLKQFVGFLPEAMIDSLAEQLGASLNFAAPDIAGQVVTTVVSPLVVPFISVVVFFVLFLVLRLLFWLLRKVAGGVGAIPGISLVNKAFGAFMGIFVGALYVYLLLCALWAWDALSPATSPGLQYFTRSVFYRVLYGLNFFAA